MNITVNGRRISISGSCSNISIIDGEVFVGGKRYTDNKDLKEIKITIEGGCGDLHVEGCNSLQINGDVHGNLSTDGSARVSGNVQNGVQAGGSISCSAVTGSVNAGGSITCGHVSGSVHAGGSVSYRR